MGNSHTGIPCHDFSSVFTRENADQVLVNRLKEKGYQDLARLLFDSYTV